MDCRCLGLFLGSLFCSTGLSVCLGTRPHCIDDCGFVILPEIWESYASCLVFTAQDCFGNSGSFKVRYTFWIVYSSSVKNVVADLIGCLDSADALGGMDHFYEINSSKPGAWSIFTFYEASVISLLNVL